MRLPVFLRRLFERLRPRRIIEIADEHARRDALVLQLRLLIGGLTHEQAHAAIVRYAESDVPISYEQAARELIAYTKLIGDLPVWLRRGPIIGA